MMWRRSKGYGFCSFYTKADAENAMAKLSGSKIGSRTVRCGWAHHKKDAMQSIDYTTIDQVQLGAHVLCTGSLDACVGHRNWSEICVRPFLDEHSFSSILLCRLTR